MAQREKPAPTVEQLEVTLGITPGSGTLLSGGQIENFREGWAQKIMPAGGVAHYFKRDPENIAMATASCGVIAQVRWLYGRGNFPCCQRCARKIRKGAR
jgi:hypothetical protein